MSNACFVSAPVRSSSVIQLRQRTSAEVECASKSLTRTQTWTHCSGEALTLDSRCACFALVGLFRAKRAASVRRTFGGGVSFVMLRHDLSGPVSRDTARLSQRYPHIARYGVIGVSTWPIGCDTPSPFSERFPPGEHAKRRCDAPPLKRGISAIPARYPIKTTGNGFARNIQIRACENVGLLLGRAQMGRAQKKPNKTSRRFQGDFKPQRTHKESSLRSRAPEGTKMRAEALASSH